MKCNKCNNIFAKEIQGVFLMFASLYLNATKAYIFTFVKLSSLDILPFMLIYDLSHLAATSPSQRRVFQH